MAAVGILGGTFDPIHYGHLIAAEEARCQFGLEKVIFVPAADPPHKQDHQLSDAEHRYAMTVLATSSNSLFECSRIEMDRPGPSYSVDTVEKLRQMMPGKDIYFVTGADAMLEIMTWHEPHRLLEMCQLVAAVRPGYCLDELRTQLPAEFSDHIVFLEMPGVQISSTDLRERVRQGKSIKYMVPEAVESYIYANNLYR